MPVDIHGLELSMFGFLLKVLKGACLSSNAITIFRKCSVETFGSGLLQCFCQMTFPKSDLNFYLTNFL